MSNLRFWSNPGTAAVEGGRESFAMLAAAALLAEAGGDSCSLLGCDESGYYDFVFVKNGRSVNVSIPGLPLELLRFEKGCNPFHFQRLYVDGNSWLWPFALNSIHFAWTPEPPPAAPDPELLRSRLERATRNAHAFAEAVGAESYRVVGGADEMRCYVEFELTRGGKQMRVSVPPTDLRELMAATRGEARRRPAELLVCVGDSAESAWAHAVDVARWLLG